MDYILLRFMFNMIEEYLSRYVVIVFESEGGGVDLFKEF